MKRAASSKHDTKVVEKLTNIETIQSLLPRFKESVLDVSNLQIVGRIGEGAFAHVYKCLHTQSEQLLAIKVMKPKIFSRESDVYDFFLEAQLLRKISHPNIVPFKGICFGDVETKKRTQRLSLSQKPQESLCVVTEFMDGGSLKDWINAKMASPNRRVYSRKQAINWMIQIARGLVYLHGSPFVIIHRDLKPENILLQEKNTKHLELEAKIADFGLSVVITKKNRVGLSSGDNLDQLEGVDSGTLPELFRHGKQGVKKNPETLRRALKGVSTCLHIPQQRGSPHRDLESSQEGKVLTGRTGSLMYMAPEVLRNQRYDEKVDVFSYGVIFYELLKGHTLLSTLPKSATIVDVKHFASEVADGYRMPIPEEWPQPIKKLIEDCWNGSPWLRPSMQEVLNRLEEIYRIGTFAEANQPGGKAEKTKQKNPRCNFFGLLPFCKGDVHNDSVKAPT